MLLPTLCKEKGQYSKVNYKSSQDVKREVFIKMPYGQSNVLNTYAGESSKEKSIILYWIQSIRKYFSRNPVLINPQTSSIDSLKQEQQNNLFLSDAILGYDLEVLVRYQLLVEKYEARKKEISLPNEHNRDFTRTVTQKDKRAKIDGGIKQQTNSKENNNRKLVKPIIDNKNDYKFEESEYGFRLPLLSPSTDVPAKEIIPNYQHLNLTRPKPTSLTDMTKESLYDEGAETWNQRSTSKIPKSKLPPIPIETQNQNKTTTNSIHSYQASSTDSESNYYSPLPHESIASHPSSTSSKGKPIIDEGCSKSTSLKSTSSSKHSNPEHVKLVSHSAQQNNRRFLQMAPPPLRSFKRDITIRTTNDRDIEPFDTYNIDSKDFADDRIDSPRTPSSIGSSTKKTSRFELSKINSNNHIKKSPVPKPESIDVVSSDFDFDLTQDEVDHHKSHKNLGQNILQITSPKQISPRQRKYRNDPFDAYNYNEDLNSTERESYMYATDSDAISSTNHTRVSSNDEEVVMFFDLGDKKKSNPIYQKFTRKPSTNLRNRTSSNSGFGSLKGLMRRPHSESRTRHSQMEISDPLETKHL